MNFRTLVLSAAVIMSLSACAQKSHKHEGCACDHKEAKKECSGKGCTTDKKCAECQGTASK